jgi:hypothetical protein
VKQVASILQGQAGRRGGPLEAAFVLAQSAARDWLGPLLDTACNRLVYVLRSLYRLALERVHIERASIGMSHTYPCFSITLISRVANLCG